MVMELSRVSFKAGVDSKSRQSAFKKAILVVAFVMGDVVTF
jgi:hypothetical protein